MLRVLCRTHSPQSKDLDNAEVLPMQRHSASFGSQMPKVLSTITRTGKASTCAFSGHDRLPDLQELPKLQAHISVFCFVWAEGLLSV